MSAHSRVPFFRVASCLSSFIALSLLFIASDGMTAPPIDATSPWATGPQTIFTQPALIRSATQQIALSYDLSSYLSRSKTTLGSQQLALSIPFGELYTFALGVRSEFDSLPLSRYRTLEAHSERTETLSIAQEFRFLKSLSLATTISRQWDTRAWQFQFGLSYEPASWLRLILNSPIVPSHSGFNLEDQIDETQWIALALKPLERIRLGLGFNPIRGGGTWSSNAYVRLWKGLRLEGRYLGSIGKTPALDRPISIALAWGGDWGWRSELNPSTTDFGNSLTASLRIGDTPKNQQLLSDHRQLLFIAHKGEDELVRRASLLGRSKITAPFLQTLQALRNARKDEDIERIVLVLNSSNLGWAQAEELAEELKALRALKREVTVFLPNIDSSNYLVAAEASEIWVRPTSEIRLSGLLTERFYLKGLLEKLKIEAEVIAIGDYKSAPEMFIKDGPSEEAKIAQQAIQDARYQRLIQALERRCLTHKQGCQPEGHKGKIQARTQAKAWLNEGPYNAREAKNAGLVDQIIHGVELDRALIGAYPHLTLNTPPLQPTQDPVWGTPNTLAILYLVGDIGSASTFGGDNISASQMIPLIRQLEARSDVKGVLLRIDSPGGAITDADEIWKSLQRLAERKPLVASMGNVAASGGYYVAAPARMIFASPNTITGSIGVFAGKANLSPALENFGVTIHRDRRGEGGGELSLFTPWTTAQRSRIQRSMEGLYELFLERVSVGRAHLTRDKLLPLAGGRVWTGAQAKSNTLVDEEGGLLDALNALVHMSKLENDAYLIEIQAPAPPSVLERINGFTQLAEPTTLVFNHPLFSTIPSSLKGFLSLLIERPSEGLAYLPQW